MKPGENSINQNYLYALQHGTKLDKKWYNFLNHFSGMHHEKISRN